MQKPLKKKILIQHFSHEHTLEHTNILPASFCTCFGCNCVISPGKHFYQCKICHFYLHQTCYDMPQKMQHPVDPNHHLTLLAMDSPVDNSVVCLACRRLVTGFYYNCARCGSFYHALCLCVPLSVQLPVHSHTLKLEYSPPYEFQCDICDKPSYIGWLYRCGLCEFDVHISCAAMDDQLKQRSLDMKLLQEEMKGKNGNLDNQSQSQSQSQDLLSVSGFQEAGTPSHQLFSIDLTSNSRYSQAKSQKLKILETNDSTSEVSYNIEIDGENEDDSMLSSQPVNDVQEKDQSVVKPHAWRKLGTETDSSRGEAFKIDDATVKYQANKPNAHCRCSCLCW